MILLFREIWKIEILGLQDWMIRVIHDDSHFPSNFLGILQNNIWLGIFNIN